MNIAVVNLMKYSDGSIIASNRIAKYLSYYLKCPLIDSREACSEHSYDHLFIVNGPMLYCNFRPELMALCNRAKNLIWVENEYTIAIPRFIKVREPAILSNCENYRGTDLYGYVNWNRLTFVKSITAQAVRYEGLCYYGAYREDRELYFKKYLGSDAYKVHISPSSKPALNKYALISPTARYFAAPDLLAVLGQYQASLYIEDRSTHQRYNSPANRFYEALSAHTLQIFDASVLNTFDRAGINVRPWTVDSPAQVAELLRPGAFNQARADQLAALRAVDHRAQLNYELAEALTTLGVA